MDFDPEPECGQGSSTLRTVRTGGLQPSTARHFSFGKTARDQLDPCKREACFCFIARALSVQRSLTRAVWHWTAAPAPRLRSGFRAAGGGTHAWDSTVFPLRGYRAHHSPGTGWGSPAAPAVESAGYTKGTLVKHFSVVPDETKLERWSLRPQCRDSPRPVLVRGPTAPWGGRDAQSPEGAPGAKPDRPG